MSTLDELFPDGRHRSHAPTVHDDHHTLRRLDALLGDRRADVEVTHRASGRSELVALVNDAAAESSPVPATSTGPSEGGSGARRRIDLLNAAVAGLAVVAVVTTAIVGGVQAATASPTDDALRVLAADEKTIESAGSALVAMRTRIAEEIAAEITKADALQKILPTVGTAPDPIDIPPGETEAPEDADRIDIIAPEALATLSSAIDAYREDQTAVELPELPAAYESKNVDEDSLADVGAAIDAAQLQLIQIDGVAANLRDRRTAVQKRADSFRTQVEQFGRLFPEAAKIAVDENPDAGQKAKDVLMSAAAAVAAADLLTDDGAARLRQYRDAFLVMRSEQVYADRVREEREREQQRERERERQRQQPAPEPTPSEPAPTPGPTEPADSPKPSGDAAGLDDVL